MANDICIILRRYEGIQKYGYEINVKDYKRYATGRIIGAYKNVNTKQCDHSFGTGVYYDQCAP